MYTMGIKTVTDNVVTICDTEITLDDRKWQRSSFFLNDNIKQHYLRIKIYRHIFTYNKFLRQNLKFVTP